MALTKKQLVAYAALRNKVAQYLLYGGAGGGGKSWLGCAWLLDRCRTFPGTRWFIGRNNLKDARASVTVTFLKVAESLGFEAFHLDQDGIQFDNDSQIIYLDLTYYPVKDPMYERFGSLEFTGGWIEEAGEIHPLAFEVLKARIGRHYNIEYDILPQMLLTCNPKKNWLYNMFYKPWREGKLSYPYMFIQALVDDNPYIGQSYIENLQNISDKTTRNRLLYGMWEYDDNPAALLDYDAICDLFTNDHCTTGGQRYISADVALKGRDYYVRAVRNGDVVSMIHRPIMEPPQVVNDILQACKDNAVPHSCIVVDSDGVGAYVPSYVGGNVVEFHGNGTSKSGKYDNIKSECAFKLAELIRDRKLKVVVENEDMHQRIMQELECLIKDHVDDDTHRISLIKKDDMKKLIGHSPDFLDCLIMLMYWEVKPKATGLHGISY